MEQFNHHKCLKIAKTFSDMELTATLIYIHTVISANIISALSYIN